MEVWRMVMREKLIRFMYGRYGVDKLSRHVVFAALPLWIASIFFRLWILQFLAVLGIVCGYYRIFSKNTTKRYRELCAYERFLGKIKGFPARIKRGAAERREYRIFKCPGCRQKLRIPKGHGTVEISCRKCGTVFRKRT